MGQSSSELPPARRRWIASEVLRHDIARPARRSSASLRPRRRRYSSTRPRWAAQCGTPLDPPPRADCLRLPDRTIAQNGGALIAQVVFAFRWRRTISRAPAGPHSAGGRQFLGHHAAASACANDHRVHSFHRYAPFFDCTGKPLKSNSRTQTGSFKAQFGIPR